MRRAELLFVRFRDRGDIAALSQVFDELAPELLLVAAHLERGPGDAEDLVQATFVDAIEKRDRWDARRRLLPWLLGILTNHARELRRRSRRELDPQRLAAGAVGSPLDAAARREAAEIVARGLSGLPRAMRQALTLRLVHGLTPAQIAHASGCPVPTVKTRLQRGLTWLRRVLPRGLRAGVMSAAAPTRQDLAGAREQVLARAAVARRAITTRGIVCVAAGVALHKVLAFAAVVLAALLLALPLPTLSGGEATPPPLRAPAAVATSAQPSLGDDPGAACGEGGALGRTALPAAPAEHAAIELAFVWEGTELPARHLQVWWRVAGGENGSPLHRCYADGDGRLALRELPAGPIEVHNLAFRRELTVRAGDNGERVVEARPTFHVHGTVVDDAGAGVGGAHVFAQSFDVSEDTRPRLVAVADDHGAFVARSDRGGSFWACAGGFVPSARIEIGTPQHVRGAIRLVLSRADAVAAGEVRAANGAAGAGARLTIVRTQERDTVHPPIAVIADARGRFRVDRLRAGGHLLLAELRDHAPLPVAFVVAAGEQRELALTMGRGASLSGTVRVSDRSAVRALLRFAVTLPDAAGEVPALCCVRQAFERLTWTDERGDYRIDGLPPGTIAIEAASTTTARAYATVALRDGDARRRDLVLLRGHSLRGRVLGPDGSPLARWNVFVHTSSPHARPSSQTAADGSFVVDGMEDDVCHVTASSMGDSELLRVHAAGVPLDGSEIVLRAVAPSDGARLRGTLPAAAEGPVAVWQLSTLPARFPDHEASAWALRGATFELGPFAPGVYEIALHRRGERPGPRMRVELAPRQHLDLGELAPPAATGRHGPR